MFNVGISGVTSVLTNKDYLEKNLIPLQIYYASKDKFQTDAVSVENKCTIKRTWETYEEIIGYNEFVNVKTTANRYETFRFKSISDKLVQIVVSEPMSYYKLSDFVPKQKVYKIPRAQLFFGVYKPLSPIICTELRIFPELKNLSTPVDKVTQLYKIWSRIERLKIIVEAILMQYNRLLKF
jgi:hypothetical protein